MSSANHDRDMEFVFVVPRRELFPEAYPHGFVPFRSAEARRTDDIDAAEFERRVVRSGFFVERERAEREPDWKQVIPYCLVTRKARGADEVLLLRRLKQGGESRLHDKLSIGVGGHLNPPDALDRSRLLWSGARRELNEELLLGAADRSAPLELLGLLNDDSNAVGAVHVGLVMRLAASEAVEVREKSVLEGRFATHARLCELREEGANFETWTAKLLAAPELWTPSNRNAELAGAVS